MLRGARPWFPNSKRRSNHKSRQCTNMNDGLLTGLSKTMQGMVRTPQQRSTVRVERRAWHDLSRQVLRLARQGPYYTNTIASSHTTVTCSKRKGSIRLPRAPGRGQRGLRAKRAKAAPRTRPDSRYALPGPKLALVTTDAPELGPGRGLASRSESEPLTCWAPSDLASDSARDEFKLVRNASCT